LKRDINARDLIPASIGPPPGLDAGDIAIIRNLDKPATSRPAARPSRPCHSQVLKNPVRRPKEGSDRPPPRRWSKSMPASDHVLVLAGEATSEKCNELLSKRHKLCRISQLAEKPRSPARGPGEDTARSRRIDAAPSQTSRPRHSAGHYLATRLYLVRSLEHRHNRQSRWALKTATNS
jgi:hypothetical protein